MEINDNNNKEGVRASTNTLYLAIAIDARSQVVI